MSLTKRLIDDLERRPAPLEDVYYGEEWPSDEELRRDAAQRREDEDSDE